MKAQREEVEPPTESACALFDGRDAEVLFRASITRLSVSAGVFGSHGLPSFPRVSVLLAAFRSRRWRKFPIFGPPRAKHGHLHGSFRITMKDLHIE